MKQVAVYAALTAIALALFQLFPHIDLWFSGLFYDPGRGFVLRDWGPVTFIYYSVRWITWSIVLVIGAAAAWRFLMERPLWRFDYKALLFVALSVALGPGLLANAVLKEHWGRARPSQIEAFGGFRQFTPAPLPAAECPQNCSFVSGHAALGFSLIAFAFLLPPGQARRRATIAALGAGTLIGLARIAQGGHFLSDVVWAGLLVFGTTAVLHWWIVDRDGLTAPAALGHYRSAGRKAAAVFARMWAFAAVQVATATLFAAILLGALIIYADRPMALYFHAQGADLRALFKLTGRLGEAWGWLGLFGAAFLALHWGADLPRLRPFAQRMRAASAVPAFLFASVALAGIIADVLKIDLGRMRPKLLFSDNLYGFTWLAWRADHWSFPSGHAATVVALTTALWWLWPRHLLFYVLVTAIVAGSRIVVGAHYPSDVIAGALVAVLATRWVAWIFVRWGIDLDVARRGGIDFGEILPWPCRRFRELSMRRRARAGVDASRPLAPPPGGVVSARDHGAADRDV